MHGLITWVTELSIWVTIPLGLIVLLAIFRIGLALVNWVLRSMWVLVGTLISLGILAYAVGTAILSH